MKTLTDQVRLERQENHDNTNGFRKSFDALYQRYSDLAAKVKNADLLEELTQTRKQLKETEAKLDQPKAILSASFWYSDVHIDNLIRRITVPRRPDGSVTFDIVVVNLSNTAALNGVYTVRICKACKFAKEPEGFQHIRGSNDEDRQLTFDRLLARSAEQSHTFEVFPQQVNEFEVDILYSCTNCISDKVDMWVSIQP